MHLTIVGCGYVGLALAERLQPRRPQLRLTLTTTTSERLDQLRPLGGSRGDLRCHRPNVQLLERPATEHQRRLLPRAEGRPPSGCQRLPPHFRRELSLLEVAIATTAGTAADRLHGQLLGVRRCRRVNGWMSKLFPSQAVAMAMCLLESERLLSGIGDRRICILRLGALYGPGRDLDRRLRGLAGQERPGSGASFSNWLHVADAAGASGSSSRC